MAEHDFTTPFLSKKRLSHSSDEAQVIITVNDAPAFESLKQSTTHRDFSDRHNGQNDQTNDAHSVTDNNPFEFLGVRGLDVPATSTIDPFRNHTPEIEGFYEWLKIVLVVPIAIVRLVLFGLAISVGYVATRFALEGWKDKQNPMPKWRCRVMWVTRVCARCILFSFGYHWIKRRGRPAPREIAPIVVSNHVIYVNRFSPSSRRHAVNEIKIPGRPIQPVIVRYPYVHFDQSWGNISLAKLMFRMFTQFHNFMEVEYLPVISPLENQKENAVHFAQRASHAIATALNVVQTSHAFGDFMLFSKASEAKKENPTLYMVEMAKVYSTFHLSSLEAVDFLDTFLSMNPDSSGHVKIDDFIRVLKLKACSLSEKIFRFLDVEKRGRITFKQFLFGSAHVLKQPLFRQACELAFAECHADGNDYISKQEFGDSVKQAIPDMNQYEIHELFKLFDLDGDGRISKDGFINCLRRNPLLIALFSPQLMHKNLSEDRKTC